jgi:hypothetical protein
MAWLKKKLKYKPLEDAIKGVLKREDEEGYKLRVKIGIVVISSLGALHLEAKN